MTIRLKRVEEQVVVITGASSGIGLAAARLFAARGVRGLVLRGVGPEPVGVLAAVVALDGLVLQAVPELAHAA